MSHHRFIQGDVLDALKRLPSEGVHCVVTSPPYWGLRDYGMPGQIGLESTPEDYDSIYIDLNPEYVSMAVKRTGFDEPTLGFDTYAVEA